MSHDETVKVEYAQLHTPLFLAGTNLSEKLDTRDLKRRGLALHFDENKRRLIVQYNGRTANIPEGNVASFVLPDPNAKEKVIPVRPVGQISAQVSSPQDHVFGGPGKGKSK